MGIFDQAKEFLQEHSDKAEQGIDKVGDFVDQRTGGQHADKVDRAQEFVKDRLGSGDAAQPDVPPADVPPADVPPADPPPPAR